MINHEGSIPPLGAFGSARGPAAFNRTSDVGAGSSQRTPYTARPPRTDFSLPLPKSLQMERTHVKGLATQKDLILSPRRGKQHATSQINSRRPSHPFTGSRSPERRQSNASGASGGVSGVNQLSKQALQQQQQGPGDSATNAAAATRASILLHQESTQSFAEGDFQSLPA